MNKLRGKADSMSIEGIVLAAGLSSRAGAFKMELVFDGKTMIEKAVEGMSECCSKIFVIGGYRIERLQEIFRNDDRVEVIYNPNYLSGMFSSVQAGVKEIKADRFFITPGDCPLIGKEVYSYLLKNSAEVVIPAFQGRKGHPVLLEKSLIGELLREPVDSNLKKFIERHNTKLVPVDEKGILLDVDTMEDYRKAIGYSLSE